MQWIVAVLWLFSINTKVLAQNEPRLIYLNGVDISSAKHQILERVTVRIDGQGHIFIEAPHYEVTEESTYIPLSSLATEQASRPFHRNAGPLPKQTPILDGGEPLQAPANQSNPLGTSFPESGGEINQGGRVNRD